MVLNPQCVLKSEPSRGCLNICGFHTDDSDLVGLVWDMMSGISVNSKFPGDLSAPGSGNYPLRRTAVDRSASLKPKHLFGGNTGKSDCPGKSTQEVLKASILLTLFSLLVILHLRGTINFFFFLPIPRWLLGWEWIIVKENDALVPPEETTVVKVGYCCLVAQSCSTLCERMDCRPPGYSVHGISQARILEGVVIFFSRGSSWSRNRTPFSRWILYPWATMEALKLPKRQFSWSLL